MKHLLQIYTIGDIMDLLSKHLHHIFRSTMMEYDTEGSMIEIFLFGVLSIAFAQTFSSATGDVSSQVE